MVSSGSLPHRTSRVPSHRRDGGSWGVGTRGQIVPVPLLVKHPSGEDGVPWRPELPGDGDPLSDAVKIEMLSVDAKEDVAITVLGQEV